MPSEKPAGPRSPGGRGCGGAALGLSGPSGRSCGSAGRRGSCEAQTGLRGWGGSRATARGLGPPSDPRAFLRGEARSHACKTPGLRKHASESRCFVSLFLLVRARRPQPTSRSRP